MKKTINYLSLCAGVAMLLMLSNSCVTSEQSPVKCPSCNAVTTVTPAYNVACTKNACPSCGNIKSFSEQASEAVKQYVGDDLQAPVHICRGCKCTVEPCAACKAKE